MAQSLGGRYTISHQNTWMSRRQILAAASSAKCEGKKKTRQSCLPVGNFCDIRRDLAYHMMYLLNSNRFDWCTWHSELTHRDATGRLIYHRMGRNECDVVVIDRSHIFLYGAQQLQRKWVMKPTNEMGSQSKKWAAVAFVASIIILHFILSLQAKFDFVW